MTRSSGLKQGLQGPWLPSVVSNKSIGPWMNQRRGKSKAACKLGRTPTQAQLSSTILRSAHPAFPFPPNGRSSKEPIESGDRNSRANMMPQAPFAMPLVRQSSMEKAPCPKRQLVTLAALLPLMTMVVLRAEE